MVEGAFVRGFNAGVNRRTKQNNDDAYRMLLPHIVGDAAKGHERPAEAVVDPSLTTINILCFLLFFVSHNILELYLFKVREHLNIHNRVNASRQYHAVVL